MGDATKVQLCREINTKREDTLKRLKTVLSERLNIGVSAERIDDDGPLFGMGLGLDSIDTLELVVGIEKEFGVTFNESDFDVFFSLNTLCDFIADGRKNLAVGEALASSADPDNASWFSAYRAVRESCLMYAQKTDILELREQEGAQDFVAWLIAGKDLILEPNRALSSAMLDPEGRIVDIPIVMMFDDRYWLIPNHLNPGGKKWILQKADEKGLRVNDVSDDYLVVVAEGPFSWKIVKPLAGYDLIGMSYMYFLTTEWDGSPLVIIRAGTCNEYGFRMFVPAGRESALIDRLSKDKGLSELWFEADERALRECLSLASWEVRYPVVGNTVEPGSSPVTNELRWMVDATKGDFSGRDAVLAGMQDCDKRIVGIRLAQDCPDDVAATCDGVRVAVGDKTVGAVKGVRKSPSLGAWIGYAEFDAAWGFAGNALYEIVPPSGVPISAVTCATPFFKTRSALVQMG